MPWRAGEDALMHFAAFCGCGMYISSIPVRAAYAAGSAPIALITTLRKNADGVSCCVDDNISTSFVPLV
jgi:hypothetical protein